MSKATTAFMSLLVIACVCVLFHPAFAPLLAAGIVSALLLVLVPVAAIAKMRSRRERCCTHGKQRFLRYAAAGLLVPLGCGFSWASFSLTFQGLVQTVNTGGSITLNSPSGIVVDAEGNVYVADTGNNRIVEVSAQGVASVVTITGLSPALSSPNGIAIDGSGNLYIADTGNNRVVEITAAGAGSAISTGSLNLSSPKGVALDQSGDIFVGDTNNSRIVEVTIGGAAAALSITVSSGSSTLNSPIGVAVDVSGKLYIADSNNNRIVTVAAGSTTGVVASILGGVTLFQPKAVAVDRMGNVFIADTGNDRIAEIDTSSNGTVLYTNSVSLNGPLGVALDVFGTVYIADTGDNQGLVVDAPVNGDLVVGDPTYSLNKTAVGFGHVQLGSSTAVTLTLVFTTSGSGGLGAVNVFTSGAQSLDFTSGTDTTCNGSTGPSTECTVEVSFLPTAPGLRNGSVVLYDTSLNPILTVPLYAWGDAPVAALAPNPGIVVSIGSVSLSDPFQVALDGAGNIYVGDYNNSNVIKIPAGGGSGTVVPLGMPGGTTPEKITGVAVDEAGNLFIGDHINSRILVVTPGGVVSVLTINNLSPAIELPTALAFDAAGNLYIADYGGGRVVRVSTLVVAGSTSSGLGVALGTGAFSFGISTLSGTAVDPQGNIYIAARTENSSSIIKVTTAGVASELSFPGITPPISGPQGVAVDAMGNVYVVDSGNNRIVRLTTAGVASALSVTGLPAPAGLGASIFGVTLDPWGNLYIPDWTNNRIVFVNVSSTVLAFPSTDVGSTSSPQTATVANLGGLPLVFALNPPYPANFSVNPGDENLCALNTSLAAGMLCDVSVEFTPLSAGPLSASIVVTNNNLNVSNATQSVAVSGTGVATADTTATAVSTNPTTVVLGQPITITALVTDTTAGHTTTIPTGGVTFMDTLGSTSISLNGGTAVTLDGTGQAILSGVALSGVGVHTITANYAGVVNTFLASSNTTTIAVTAVVTATTLTAAPNPAIAGQSVTFTATVAPAPTGTPLGSVNFFNGATLLGNATVNSSGIATFATASLPIGADSITAVYSGNAGFATSTSTAVSETVTLAATTTTLTAAPNPAIFGQSVTFTATTTPAPTGAPLGSVNFFDGATLVGNGTVDSSGIATFITATLPVGANSITAVYSGNAGFATSTSTAVSETVTLAATTATLIAAPNPAIFGQSVTFTATIAPAPTGTPLGSVNFFDGATLLGNATVNSLGIATFTTSSLPAGADSITSVYSGNAGFATSTSTAVSEAVTLVATATTLIVAPNPAIVGQSVTFTATVAPMPTSTPLGSVSFFNGATLLGNATVNSSGTATLATASLTVGADSITAVYSGDAGFATSTSTAVSETVTLAATTTVLSAAPNPALVGQSVTFTATVAPAPTGTPLGSVNFFDGATLLGNATVNSLGIATFAAASLPLGADSITAVYSGNAGFATSTSIAVSEAITMVVTTSTLTVSPTPLFDGQTATLTATVSPAPTGSPVGTLSFYSGATLLGTGTLDASGVAIFTTSALVVGDDSLTAVYAGNAGFAASTSFAVIETVTPSYTVTGPTTPATVAPGGVATIDMTVPPLGGAFNNVVTLSATGLPPGATVTFTPPTVTPGSEGATTVMTIQLGAAVASNTDRGIPAHHQGLPVAQFSLAFVLFGAVLARKRLPRTLVLALALTVLGVATSLVTSCGGGFSAPPSYTITVTGTSGTFQASTTVTLMVK